MNQNPSRLAADLPQPTVTIYQNPEFISGLIQEMYKTGLLETRETESKSTNSQNSSSTASMGAEAEVEGRLFPLKARARANGQYSGGLSENDEKAAANSLKFVYSQAYYLDQVRSTLRQQNRIIVLDSLGAAKKIKAGDFVEFEASFRANEANAILDILTPELTRSIAHYFRKAAGIEQIEEISADLEAVDENISIEKITAIRAIHEEKAENDAKLAAAVTKALRTDFRGDVTKEFYAQIITGDQPLTAVTVCEAAHFVSLDTDRLLDGRFTVLGKAVSKIRYDVPVLEKNKLLNRLKIESIGDNLLSLTDNDKAEEFLNLNFSTVIDGASITVLPIAIYV